MSEAAAVPDSVEGVVEAAGHFRVYLGAAAGVGKTYAMLNEGHRRQARGSGVVVGFVESHGRQLTEKLVEGLEVVPRQVVDYRGSRLEEMDLDAVLRRHPKIALIDELAHTNVPGSGRAHPMAAAQQRRLQRDADHPGGRRVRHRRSCHRPARAARRGAVRGHSGVRDHRR